MAKLNQHIDNKAGQPDFTFECPGCKVGHSVWIDASKHRVTWEYNGNIDSPTFSPSLLVRFPWNGKEVICHSFIRDGKIQFLSDCTHELAGQTVEMYEVER